VTGQNKTFNHLGEVAGGSPYADRVYGYTADGERLAHFDSDVGGTTFTIRDLEGHVLREYLSIGTTWTWKEDYVWGPNGLLATISPTEGTKHYTLDHLGSPRLVCDRCADMKAQHNYFPFGEEAANQYQDTEQMKFTGHERDLGLTNQTTDDLDYMHARHFNMHIGRFLSVDRVGGDVGSSQSWDAYSYVKNQPMAGVDSTGKIGPGPSYGDMLTVWALKDMRPQDRLRLYLQIQRTRQRFTGYGLQLMGATAIVIGAPEVLAPRLASLGLKVSEAGLRTQAIVGGMAGFFSARGWRRPTAALAGVSLGLIPFSSTSPVANAAAGFLGNSSGQLLSPSPGGFSLNLAGQAAAAGAFGTVLSGFLAVGMPPDLHSTVLPGLNAGIQAAFQHLVNTSWGEEHGVDDATAASTVVRCGGSYGFLNDCPQ